MSIAIIGGTGPEGSGLALRWAQAGETIIIGSRDPQRAAEAAAKMSERGSGVAGVPARVLRFPAQKTKPPASPRTLSSSPSRSKSRPRC